ncbi:hypothetical protein B0J18DRAFT_414979 [Chaetomium sp. MPI-SDFR-AT-0129]|nr:hypothetical protein B0J18DRAFT_414979 [Chaetomium sp. MPI-SDFR-AT-0129]
MLTRLARDPRPFQPRMSLLHVALLLCHLPCRSLSEPERGAARVFGRQGIRMRENAASSFRLRGQWRYCGQMSGFPKLQISQIRDSRPCRTLVSRTLDIGCE